MAQYLGVDILEREPEGRIARSDSFLREVQPVGSPFGRVDPDDHQGISVAVRDYLWVTRTPQDVTALKDFLRARRGRAVPFWLPSLTNDVRMAADAGSGASSIDIKTIGYATFLWPGTAARRHLSLRPVSGGTALYRKVLNAVDNLNGTESLYLDAPLGVNVIAATWIVSFLRYCRLEDDIVRMEFQGRGYCEARLRARELPHEIDDLGTVVVVPPPAPSGYGYGYGLEYGGVSG